jgi:hypothetical protein
VIQLSDCWYLTLISWRLAFTTAPNGWLSVRVQATARLDQQDQQVLQTARLGLLVLRDRLALLA